MAERPHRIDVQVTTPLNPTERRDRVEDAITALFPTASIEERHGELLAEAHSMAAFAEKLEAQGIVNSARDVFVRSVEGNAFSFDLKKQAATHGIVNFAVGDPGELGELHVRVRVTEPSVTEFIDAIAPATGDGGSDE